MRIAIGNSGTQNDGYQENVLHGEICVLFPSYLSVKKEL